MVEKAFLNVGRLNTCYELQLEAFYEGRAGACRYNEPSLNDPFTVPALMLALRNAAIKHNPRRLHEKSYRTAMAERLLKEESRVGRHFWKEAQEEIMQDVEAHKAKEIQN